MRLGFPTIDDGDFCGSVALRQTSPAFRRSVCQRFAGLGRFQSQPDEKRQQLRFSVAWHSGSVLALAHHRADSSRQAGGGGLCSLLSCAGLLVAPVPCPAPAVERWAVG